MSEFLQGFKEPFQLLLKVLGNGDYHGLGYGLGLLCILVTVIFIWKVFWSLDD